MVALLIVLVATGRATAPGALRAGVLLIVVLALLSAFDAWLFRRRILQAFRGHALASSPVGTVTTAR